MINRNISDTVNNKLCTGCMTCQSFCASYAIKIIKDDDNGIYKPFVDCNKCTNCEICVKVCPGNEVDFDFLNRSLFGKVPENSLIGHYINLYVGHSLNKKIRYDSSSGGLVTQLLVFALKNRIIDGVIIAKSDEQNPLEPKPVLTKDINEVIQAMGSKYCPVPTNSKLVDILNSNGKFAVVGLPCHIHGIRKAMQINKNLADKMVICFGLFCNHAPNLYATRFLLDKFNIKIDEIKRINWRGNGWPGGVIINLKNDKEVFIPLSAAWKILNRPEFYPPRCTVCTDLFCELADISFGDAWLSKYTIHDKIGTNIAIVRNKIGDVLINLALDNKEIELDKISLKDVLESQKYSIYIKKYCYVPNRAIFKFLNKCEPRYAQTLQKPYIRSYISTIYFYIRILLSKMNGDKNL